MPSVRPRRTSAGQLVTLYSLGTVGSLTDDQLVEIFLARDDPAASEAAFSALVDRHGAMVLSVCQRVLQNPHDAHDAFQATFLVLVRKAASIRRRESVGGWLFGIARRVAVRARLEAARRRHHLEKLGVERQHLEWRRESRSAHEPEPDYGPLIAEIDRLPERFRERRRSSLLRGAQCGGGRRAAGLSSWHGTLAARPGPRAIAAATRAPGHFARGPHAGHLGHRADCSRLRRSLRPSSRAPFAPPAAWLWPGRRSKASCPRRSPRFRAGSSAISMFAKVKVASVFVILGMASAAIGLSMAAQVDQKPRPTRLGDEDHRNSSERSPSRRSAQGRRESEGRFGRHPRSGARPRRETGRRCPDCSGAPCHGPGDLSAPRRLANERRGRSIRGCPRPRNAGPIGTGSHGSPCDRCRRPGFRARLGQDRSRRRR